jgi:hypothetical protein
MLHYILNITGHLYAQETDPLLINIVTPIKLKFLKYWQNIPLLYSFAFILDPRANMRGFYNVFQLLSHTISTDYSSCFSKVRTELYKLYNKYENRFGAIRSQRYSQTGGSTSKKNNSMG